MFAFITDPLSGGRSSFRNALRRGDCLRYVTISFASCRNNACCNGVSIIGSGKISGFRFSVSLNAIPDGVIPPLFKFVSRFPLNACNVSLPSFRFAEKASSCQSHNPNHFNAAIFKDPFKIGIRAPCPLFKNSSKYTIF
jgi:hypothetical protein